MKNLKITQRTWRSEGRKQHIILKLQVDDSFPTMKREYFSNATIEYLKRLNVDQITINTISANRHDYYISIKDSKRTATAPESKTYNKLINQVKKKHQLTETFFNLPSKGNTQGLYSKALNFTIDNKISFLKDYIQVISQVFGLTIQSKNDDAEGKIHLMFIPKEKVEIEKITNKNFFATIEFVLQSRRKWEPGRNIIRVEKPSIKISFRSYYCNLLICDYKKIKNFIDEVISGQERLWDHIEKHANHESVNESNIEKYENFKIKLSYNQTLKLNSYNKIDGTGYLIVSNVISNHIESVLFRIDKDINKETKCFTFKVTFDNYRITKTFSDFDGCEIYCDQIIKNIDIINSYKNFTNLLV